MSNPPERPWTEEEKYALFTEILKKAGVPSTYLFNIIRHIGIIPSWTDIPLPPGRSLNSCQNAFRSMSQLPLAPTQAPLPPPRLEPPLPPAPRPDAGVPRKRPLYPLEKATTTPRAIQPRPPPLSSTRYSVESGASIQVSHGMESTTSRGEPPRKRGRPSKAETERRKAVAQARGETYPPPRRSTNAKPRNPTTPSGVTSGGSEGAAGSPQAAVQTPEMQKPGNPSKGSVRKETTQMETGADRRGEVPQQANPGQTLPSLQSMQLDRGEATPRTIRGDPVPTPILPLGFPFAERDQRPPRGGTRSTPQQPPVSAPEMSASTGASRGMVQAASGPKEEKT
ncbi:hypothetical protein VTN02DRAFT_1149 [Thermoascus thermophilus]